MAAPFDYRTILNIVAVFRIRNTLSDGAPILFHRSNNYVTWIRSGRCGNGQHALASGNAGTVFAFLFYVTRDSRNAGNAAESFQVRQGGKNQTTGIGQFTA